MQIFLLNAQNVVHKLTGIHLSNYRECNHRSTFDNSAACHILVLSIRPCKHMLDVLTVNPVGK